MVMLLFHSRAPNGLASTLGHGIQLFIGARHQLSLLLGLATLITNISASQAQTSSSSTTTSTFESDNINLQDFELSEDEVVTVEGKSIVRELSESSQEVKSIDITRAHSRSGELGRTLVKTEGLNLKTATGIGSEESLSLNGLTDQRIRVFIDGIPIELSGYSFGLNAIPPNLIDRVDIYRGVVPINIGVDALGGALNLISTPPSGETQATLSYQTGSLQTHRFFGHLEVSDDTNSYYLKLLGFIDSTENNYDFEVEEAYPQGFPTEGQLETISVSHTNNAYQAAGSRVEVGILDQSWADFSNVAIFFNRYFREIPHELTSNEQPYLDVSFERWVFGLQTKYEKNFFDSLSLAFTFSYVNQVSRYLDNGPCSDVDWRGICAFNLPANGEDRDNLQNDLRTDQQGLFSNLYLNSKLTNNINLNLSISPRFESRKGRDRIVEDIPFQENSTEVIKTPREVLSIISGAELELNLWEDRIQTTAFFKYYLQEINGSRLLSRPTYIRRSRNDAGFGHTFRIKLSSQWQAKASYEWAIRLPTPEELFGTGDNRIAENLTLTPSRSHNANLSLEGRWNFVLPGQWHASAHGFFRHVDNYILLEGETEFPAYQNIGTVRIVGIEGDIGWIAPGEWLSISVNATTLESEILDGIQSYANNIGSRIKNQPYLFANSSITLQRKSFISTEDSIALTLDSRYIHEFLFGYQNKGSDESKLIVPSQLFHDLALVYRTTSDQGQLSFSIESLNFTNEGLVDYLGLPKPGRTIYFKLLLQI